MFSLFKKIFYEVPRRALNYLWENRHNNFIFDSNEKRKRKTKFVEKEIDVLGYEIDLIEDVLDRPIIPSLLEYELQSGALNEEDLKYLDRRSQKKATELRTGVHSEILTNLSSYKRNVPSYVLDEYFQLWRSYNEKLTSLEEKHEDLLT